MQGYKVQFVGLAYFLQQANGRHVLFPDGRAVPGVTPHTATIAVAKDDLAGDDAFTGWDEADILRSEGGGGRELLQFPLSGESISIQGASAVRKGKPLKASKHSGALQPLTATSRGPRVNIVPQKARTVADMKIRSGELKPFRFPGSDDDDDQAAVISELGVPYDGRTVTIKVTAKANGDRNSAKKVRTITVRNGSEIAIVNASRPPHIANENEDDHFQIYRQLAPDLVVSTPSASSTTIPVSDSTHLLFEIADLAGTSVKCSNTCC